METNQPTLEEQKRDALKLYNEGATAIHHFSSFIERCIKEYHPKVSDEAIEKWAENCKNLFADDAIQNAYINGRIDGAKSMCDGQIKD